MHPCGLDHEDTNEVMGDQVEGDYLCHYIIALGVDPFHAQSGFHITESDFNTPSELVEPGNGFRGVSERIEQSGEQLQSDLFALPVADRHGDLAQGQCRW